MTPERADIVIIGGGQSGLSAAHAASQEGLQAVLLTAADEAVGSWPQYYDSLTLFSPARYSQLPGRPLGGNPERYARRDEIVDYLRAYASALETDIRCGQRVERVGRLDGELTVTTAAGLTLRAPLVIAASGSYGSPNRPALPGLDRFAGPVRHAAEYRSPDEYVGRRVVVVGGGNSAVQIAVELAAVAQVTLTTRSPLRIRAQRPLGRDVHWWLTRSGLDTAPIGRWLQGRTTPVLDDGRYRAALASGNPRHRPLFSRLDGDTIVWPDGARDRADALILATGYRPHLPYLAGTAALDRHGVPLHRAGVSTSVPGLGYVGLEYQRSIASATLRGGGADAQRVIRRLRRAMETGRSRALRLRPVRVGGAV